MIQKIKEHELVHKIAKKENISQYRVVFPWQDTVMCAASILCGVIVAVWGCCRHEILMAMFAFGASSWSAAYLTSNLCHTSIINFFLERAVYVEVADSKSGGNS